MIGVVEQKIKDIKRNNCQKTATIRNDCYQDSLSNVYLPTLDELNKESVYLNRSPVQIATLKDDIEYTVT